MQLFQSGERPSSVMMKHARGYTEEEIRLLAEYFSKQK
jgi:sulfide dehydrogenase cytochrome subunit